MRHFERENMVQLLSKDNLKPKIDRDVKPCSIFSLSLLLTFLVLPLELTVGLMFMGTGIRHRQQEQQFLLLSKWQLKHVILNRWKYFTLTCCLHFHWWHNMQLLSYFVRLNGALPEPVLMVQSGQYLPCWWQLHLSPVEPDCFEKMTWYCGKT